MTEMQEHAQALTNIDLVLSQLPLNVLHRLHKSVTQYIQLCAKSTSIELVKVTADNKVLHEEYSKLMLERDKVVQRTTRFQQTVKEVYNNIL
jgi:hypothetical protein